MENSRLKDMQVTASKDKETVNICNYSNILTKNSYFHQVFKQSVFIHLVKTAMGKISMYIFPSFIYSNYHPE